MIDKFFRWWRQRQRTTRFRTFQRVRVVEMRGCMADVRHNPREGFIHHSYDYRPYGESVEYPYVCVSFPDGTLAGYPADKHLWTFYDGLFEYRD